MRKKKLNISTDDVDALLSTQSRNRLKNKKPLSFGGAIFIFVAIIIGLGCLLYFANCFSYNQTTILGIIGATFISLFAVFYTINKEARENYRKAKKDARILTQLLESIDSQISRIENGMNYPILYPPNWLDYYGSCSVYLKYDYLGYLLREFELCEKINSCISKSDIDGLSKLLKYRKRTITDWTFDFSILSVRFNLSNFSMGMEEDRPWKLEWKYKEFEKFFVENYSNRTKELTVEYLVENNSTCDTNSAEYYVMKKIREEAGIKSGKYKYEAVDNRKMLSAIFKVYLSLEKNDPFSLCWGELTLKK